jgi:hypothetical protein
MYPAGKIMTQTELVWIARKNLQLSKYFFNLSIGLGLLRQRLHHRIETLEEVSHKTAA